MMYEREQKKENEGIKVKIQQYKSEKALQRQMRSEIEEEEQKHSKLILKSASLKSGKKKTLPKRTSLRGAWVNLENGDRQRFQLKLKMQKS